MPLAHPDARSWALACSSAETPRLGMLESVACQAHPELVQTFGEDGAAMARLLRITRPSALRRGITAVGVVLAIACIISPVLGMAALGSGSFFVDPVDAAISVPLAVVAFTIAFVTNVIVFVAWLRNPAQWTFLARFVGSVTAGAAVFASLSMPTVAQRDDYELTAFAPVPLWVSLTTGVLLVLATYARRHSRAPEAPLTPPEAPELSDRDAAEHAARQLGPIARDAILADRNDALRILAERGLIGDELSERARTSPLGTLFLLD